jgi:hypothetical protein
MAPAVGTAAEIPRPGRVGPRDRGVGCGDGYRSLPTGTAR